MKRILAYFICLSFFILMSCERITEPVSITEYDFNKILFKQTSQDYFNISSQNELLMPAQIVKRIIYSQIERDEVIFSEQIPFEYSTVNGQFRLEFSYRQRSRSNSDTISFLLSFESDKKVLYTIDTTFTLQRLEEEDFQEFFRFETLGAGFQQARISQYDLHANSLVFIDDDSLKLYNYNLDSDQLTCLATFENWPGAVASSSIYTFISIDQEGLFRYNHNIDSLDMQIDLSQLEYNIGERKFCYGMNVFRDSLFVIYYNYDANNQMIASFDLDGRYFGSFMVDNLAMGAIGSLAQYENLIFTFMDAGFTIWNRYTSQWDDLYYPSYGNRGGDCRIFQDRLYFIDNDNRFIFRVPMEKVVRVLFNTYAQ